MLTLIIDGLILFYLVFKKNKNTVAVGGPNISPSTSNIEKISIEGKKIIFCYFRQ